MTEQEYLARALPRLEQIESLDKRCAWDKWDCECTESELSARRQRKILMDAQGADEVAMGY
jgi:hypothetical protein